MSAFKRLWIDFPEVGFSLDWSLMGHFIRDAVMAGLWVLVFRKFGAGLAEGAMFAFYTQAGFALGYEARERNLPRLPGVFFGVGDAVMGIAGAALPMLVLTGRAGLVAVLPIGAGFLGILLVLVVVNLLNQK